MIDVGSMFLSTHGHICFCCRQAANLQGFQVFQTAAADEDAVTLVDTSSAISVQPLAHRKEEPQEIIEPPIPKVGRNL